MILQIKNKRKCGELIGLYGNRETVSVSLFCFVPSHVAGVIGNRLWRVESDQLFKASTKGCLFSSSSHLTILHRPAPSQRLENLHCYSMSKRKATASDVTEMSASSVDVKAPQQDVGTTDRLPEGCIELSKRLRTVRIRVSARPRKQFSERFIRIVVLAAQ